MQTMQKSLLALVALALLAGCGTSPSGLAAKALAASALATRSADADKHPLAPPAPSPLTQGFTRSDVTAVAAAAYAQAYAAKTPKEAQETASTAYAKIVALMPDSPVAKQIVPFAQALLKANLAEAENERRAALWPLLYVSKGLESTEDPLFFELQGKTLESMTTWKDGLAVGLASFDFLSDSSNGYVKTMAAKAIATFKSPSSDVKGSVKMMLDTLKDIGDTLKTVGANKAKARK